MKIIAIVIVSIILLICVYFVFLSATASRPEGGMENGRLQNCPDKPNCVNSEPDSQVREGQSIEPLILTAPDQWKNLPEVIKAQGGKVTQFGDNYLRAEFQSRLFRFVDDLEIRLDENKTTLHIRSASRAGTSDLGVNRKRVEALRATLN